ncbi:fungal specific transcription factor protein [Rutstroemia sp. NJR-2017a BBW]|nr:fungal specific transcription factor protein [Rutstroemia sp. NJR-2017a BBW]
MAARISELERSLAKTKEEKSKESPNSVSVSSPGTTTNMPLTSLGAVDLSSSSRPGDDILIEKGSSSQYFNEIILSKAIEGEQSVESVLQFSRKEHLNPPAFSPFNALGILSCPSSSYSPSTLHPPKHLAVRLWRIYVDNVEGWMGLKVLHIPTDEVKVYATIDDPSSAPPQSLAFNFAIYFAAIVSMDDSEAFSILGMEKTTLLVQMKDGLEQSFAHGDFLNHPTIVGLHALAIYLVGLVDIEGAGSKANVYSRPYAFTIMGKAYGSWTVLPSE